MESIILLSIYLKSGVIKHIFENLEPFLNIKEQDGIYFYRTMIILKTVFFLHAVESIFPKCVAWLMLAVANAFLVYKYLPVPTVLIVSQFLIFLAFSKRLVLFISMALVCVLSMNIKSCEFILDLSVAICLITYAFQTYCHEFQKLWTVTIINIFIADYVCNLHTFSTKQFFLIVCFLFLSYIPLKPRNKHSYRLLYFYVLVFIWISYKFHVTNLIETPILIDNSKLHKKWGYYETTITSNNIESKSLLKKFRNPKMAKIYRAKLAKYRFDNLTSYSDFRKNICRINDVENKYMDNMVENFESNNGLRLQDKIFSFGKVKNVPEETCDEISKGLQLQFFVEKNDKLRSTTSTGHSRGKGNPGKPLLIDSELILRYIFDSIQKRETKDEKRNTYNPTRKFNYLLVLNNRADEELSNNHKKVIDYEKRPLYAPIILSKYKQKGAVRKEELKGYSNLKRETKVLDVIIEKKSAIKRILIPNGRIMLHKYKHDGSVAKEEFKVDNNLKRETNIMRATKMRKSKARKIPHSPGMLKFKTLADITRENSLKREQIERNIIRAYLKEEILKIVSDTENHSKRKKRNRNKMVQEKDPGY